VGPTKNGFHLSVLRLFLLHPGLWQLFPEKVRDLTRFPPPQRTRFSEISVSFLALCVVDCSAHPSLLFSFCLKRTWICVLAHFDWVPSYRIILLVGLTLPLAYAMAPLTETIAPWLPPF